MPLTRLARIDKDSWLTMDLNQQKARFSIAYIESIASVAGLHVSEIMVDQDSVDGVFWGDFGRRPRIEFQAKSTAQDVVRGDRIHFPLSVKNYNDLRIRTINPRILIVLVMPQDVGQWIHQTRDELCLRYCAYWLSLRDLPPTRNTDNITVHLPMANMLGSDQLTDMIHRTERTGAL